MIIDKIKKELGLLARLGRLRMTIFSAVTFSTAFTLALHYDHSPSQILSVFDIKLFLWGWLFTLLCQLSAHFLGEYYDYKADVANKHASPFTGGSRVLVSGGYSPERCRNLGWGCCVFSLLTLTLVLPSRVHLLGIIMVFFSTQYSGTPFRFNHHALGELNAALVMNILLPYFSACLASPSFSTSTTFPQNLAFYDHRLAMLIVPPAIIKFALFIVLNLADKRSDWLAGKITLPVILGDDRSVKLHAASMILAYLSAIFIYINNNIHSSHPCPYSIIGTILLFATAIPAYRICSALCSRNRPYQITPLVLKSLQHAPLPLLVIFFDCFVEELRYSTSILGAFNHFFSLSFQIRCLPVYPYLYTLLTAPRGPPPSTTTTATTTTKTDVTDDKDRVIIAGGGIAGIVLAICLSKLNIPFIIVEKKGANTQDDGADLGLWPSSVKILKELGVEEEFWDEASYPVKKVHMSMMSGKTTIVENEDVMKLVNMEKVVEGTNEHFRLIGRRELMDNLMKLLKESIRNRDGQATENSKDFPIQYSTRIVDIEEKVDHAVLKIQRKDGEIQELKGRIVVGADGINSTCRSIIAKIMDGQTLDKARYSGEVCYRGVCEFSTTTSTMTSSTSPVKDLFINNEKTKPDTMTIWYGDGIRASWGLINKKATRGHWWIKVKQDSYQDDIDHDKMVSKWPHPLKMLYDATEKSQLYIHPILDRIPSNRWCSERVVLVGDAAHPVTPNMGQGANMAIEDSFLLAILLSKRFKNYPKDGHQEAFYEYFHIRHPHTSKIANESYNQSKMGQWTNPVLVSLRETLLRRIPASVLQNKLKSVNLWKVDVWLNSFRANCKIN